MLSKNILRGGASVFVIYPKVAPRKRSPEPFVDDAKALTNDWLTIAKDLAKSVEHYEGRRNAQQSAG